MAPNGTKVFKEVGKNSDSKLRTLNNILHLFR